MIRLFFTCITILFLATTASAFDVTVEVYRDGKPVPNAEVALTSSYEENNRPIVVIGQPMAVGADGKVEMVLKDRFSRLVAKDNDGNVGSVEYEDLNRYGDYLGGKQKIRINLIPTQKYTLKVADSDGKPIVGLSVYLLSAVPIAPKKESYLSSEIFKLPESYGWKSTSDAQGRLQFDHVPKDHKVLLSWVTPDYGDGRIGMLELSKEELRLQKAGSLRINFDFDPKYQIPKVGTWSPVLSKLENTAEPSSFGFLQYLRADSLYTGVVPGKYALGLPILPNVGRIMPKDLTVEIKPGQTTVVNVKTTPAAILTGQFVDDKTGQGIEGLSIFIQSAKRDETKILTTDTDGKYTALVLGNQVYGLWLNRLIASDNRRYINPPLNKQTRAYVPGVEVKPDEIRAFETIKLVEARTVRGRILDANQKPIEGESEVYCPTGGFDIEKLTLNKHKFIFQGLRHDTPLTFRIRNGKAVNVPQPIEQDQILEEETFNVSEENAVKVKGRIEDQRGLGVSGVNVTLYWNHANQGTGTSSSRPVGATTTDAQGHYVFEGCWANESYYIGAKDARFGEIGQDYNKRTKPAKPGDTVEYDTLVVTMLNRVAKGRVIGRDGFPIAGVKVQTCGETPKAVVATTDAEGRFTLSALPATPLLITASKKDYRHSYIIDDPEKAESRIVLHQLSEPPVPIPVIAAQYLKDRHQATVAILEGLYAKQTDMFYRSRYFGYAYRFDQDLAKRWQADATEFEAKTYQRLIAYQTTLPQLAARIRANPAEEIAALIKTDNRGSFKLLEVAELLVAEDPKTAILCAQEAEQVHRAMFAQRRSGLPMYICRSGAIYHRAGNQQEGLKLLEEARKIISEIEEVKDQDSIRSFIASIWAKVSVPTALQLLDPITRTYDYNFGIGRIAEVLAKTDSKSAIELLKKRKNDPSGSSDFLTTSIRVALEIAERDLEAALQVIEGISEPVQQVQGYMELAAKLGNKQPQKAYQWIDKAFAILNKNESESGFDTYSNFGGRSIAAAQVLNVARKIGHPDLHSLLARTLEYRNTQYPERDSGASQARFAFAIAMTDPAVGAAIMAAVDPGKRITLMNKAGQRDFLFAIMMTEPQRFQQLFEDFLRNPEFVIRVGRSGLSELLNTMTDVGNEMEASSSWLRLMFRSLNDFPF